MPAKYLSLALLAVFFGFLILILPSPINAQDSLFEDDFDDGDLNNWSVVNGSWSNNTKTLFGSANTINQGGEITVGSYDWDNYKVEFDVNNNLGVDESIYFRRSLTGGNAYIFNLRHGTGAFGTPQIILWKQTNGVPSIIQSKNNFSLLNNTWYHIKVEVNGDDVKLFLNNIEIFDYNDPGTTIKKGNFSFTYWTGTFGKAQVRFDNIKVTSLNQPSANTPTPFLDLPWDYESNDLTFNDSATAINSFFDHEYPLLSSGLGEPQKVSDSIYKFEGLRTDESYSSHDGYDYGRKAKVKINDHVLAAADGEASFDDTCGACGNMIVIDHGNGYQTRYLHLQKDGLITDKPENKVNVSSGDAIGKVGATGNVSPPGDAGAHIHFGVFQDKDNDDNFNNNIPDGATDPFGWQSSDIDPWSIYEHKDPKTNQVLWTGNKSYYLWKHKLDNLDATLTSNGGIFNVGRVQLEFLKGTTDQNLNIKINSTSISDVSNLLSSLGAGIIAIAYDNLGNLITSFQNFFTLTIDFSQIDINRFKEDTISIYSSSDGINWTQEPTSLDLLNKKATSQLNHFTYFALLGERIDLSPPTTNSQLSGIQGQINWFRSDVALTLNPADNLDGLGIDYTMYRIEGNDWEIYKEPLNFSNEGRYKIEFYSVDNDENLEEIKTVEFNIDKTPPQILLDANPKIIWPPDNKMVDVVINGNSIDSNLSSTNLEIEDEYNKIEPAISNFGQTIQLEASRDGSDQDGRVYIIKVVSEDFAGNISEANIQVIVPHDQGNKQ